MYRHLAALIPNRRGSVMIEFAFVIPILIFMIIGVAVIGMLINAKLVVASAAREAGRTWSIVRTDGPARQRAAETVTGMGLPLEHDGRQLFDAARDVRFQQRGDYVYASVTYRQPTFVPLMAELIDPDSPNDGLVTIRYEAVFRVER